MQRAASHLRRWRKRLWVKVPEQTFLIFLTFGTSCRRGLSRYLCHIQRMASATSAAFF